MKISEEVKTAHFKDNQNMAMVNLFYTANWFRDLHKQVFKKYGLLPQHYNVLRIVNGRFPDPITPGEIKQVMLDKGPDVTRLVDKLVKIHLIDRCLNETNRRSMEIRISQNGQKLLDQMTQDLETMAGAQLNLTDSEAQKLSELLDKSRG